MLVFGVSLFFTARLATNDPRLSADQPMTVLGKVSAGSEFAGWWLTMRLIEP